MVNNILIFLIALVSSLLLTPLAMRLSYKFKILDQPGHRKIHKKPIPLMGGIAIFASLALTSLFLGTTFEERVGAGIVGLLFIAFGFLDDAGIKVRARYKIWAHLAFSFLFVFLTGVSFNLFKFDPINWVLTACFITFMTNSMNMLDGMDGLVAGVAFLGSLFFFVLALNNNLPDLALIAIAIAGAALGFLRYNFNPASIFLGEAGSTLIGFLLAFLSLKLKIFKLWNIALILNIPRLQFVSFIIPLIILGVPIFDTFFVFVNRFFHRIKMTTPGKDHSHHRIHLMGLSQRATVLVIYGMQIVLGLVALAMVNADFQQFVSLLLIVGMLAVSVWFFLVGVEVYPSEPLTPSGQ
jgi:UDP-GlcNAc:undecaprenyl-phosphate GlcNAc-1-phosphate transferase